MHPNDANWMTNSVDPDQTAPRSSLMWICTVYLDLSFQQFRIFYSISIDKLINLHRKQLSH